MRLITFGSYCLPLLILITIFTLSSQDATTSAALSQRVTTTVNTFVSEALTTEGSSTPCLSHDQIRSLAHIALFCLFAMSCMVAFSLRQETIRYRIPYTLFFSLVCALMDEIIQRGSPGRACELIDIGKDMLGACIGIICIWVLYRLWHRFKQ